MNTSLILFRGINVGGRNILPMKELTAILEDLGYSNVRTYIQSGNAIISSAKKCTNEAVAEISTRITKTHGFEPQVLLLHKSELNKAVANNPFMVEDGKALHFYFLGTRPGNPDIEKLQKLKTATEKFELNESVFYLHAPAGVGRSKLAAAVENCLGVTTTARNLNTVRKLQEMINA